MCGCHASHRDPSNECYRDGSHATRRDASRRSANSVARRRTNDNRSVHDTSSRPNTPARNRPDNRSNPAAGPTGAPGRSSYSSRTGRCNSRRRNRRKSRSTHRPSLPASRRKPRLPTKSHPTQFCQTVSWWPPKMKRCASNRSAGISGLDRCAADWSQAAEPYMNGAVSFTSAYCLSSATFEQRGCTAVVKPSQ